MSVIELNAFVDTAALYEHVGCARQEDMGDVPRDVTSEACIPAEATATAAFRARRQGVACGLAVTPVVVEVYDDAVQCEAKVADGAVVAAGEDLAVLRGSLHSILAIERVALNYMTHLSGIATLTRQYVDAVAGTRAKICDTRKTIPTLRGLAKYAVACGGGVSHRMGLHDAVLIKDNHIAHIDAVSLGEAMSTAVERARSLHPPPKFVQVEVDTLEQLEAVLSAGPDMVLLDNMPPDVLKQAVALRARVAGNVLLEASGGVNLKTVGAIAASGVDRISVGALTHSAPALDIGLDIEQ